VTPNAERRSDRARSAILAAALELTESPGFQVTSVEAIAKHAGVGKQTIYRWWPSKGAVVLEALNERAGPTLDFPDTGDIVADLNTQMAGVAGFLADPRFAGFAGLVGAAQSDPALSRALLDEIIEPRVIACRKRLESAQRDGQISEGIDLDEIIEMLYGPIYYRLLFRTRPITEEQVAHIIDLVFDGVRP
jgi:AcrR family transcriptional regulator